MPAATASVDIGRMDTLPLTVGDIVRIVTSGGGGYGDPLDARSATGARSTCWTAWSAWPRPSSDYGVVIARDTRPKATAASARRTPCRRQPAGLFTLGAEREAYDAIWTPPLCAAFIRIIYALPIPMRSEARQKLWTVVEDRAQRGLPTDAATLETAWGVMARGAKSARHGRRPVILPAA